MDFLCFVFQEDIAPKVIKVISLGDALLDKRAETGLVRLPAEVLSSAARETVEILIDGR